jgi:hypothetical protein
MCGEELGKNSDGDRYAYRRISTKKHRTTTLEVDCATSMPVDRQRKGEKPPEDSDEVISGTHPRRSERYKASKRRGERDSPPHHNRPKEGEYTLENLHSDRHK